MIHFSTWTLEQARVYCAAYAAAVPFRGEWLGQELQARGQGRDLLAGPEGLPELWAWATNLVDTGPMTLELLTPQPAGDPQPGVRPPWHSQDEPSELLSDGALWLIDLLGVHVAALLLEACPNAYWDVFRSTGRIPDGSQHKTKLFGTFTDGVDLASNVHGSVIGHVGYGKPWSKQRSLEGLYALTLDACRGN
jgi:hypothetical protein